MKYHNQTGNVASPNKTVAEFFAGIGLMRMGLEQADWKVLFANDICPDKEQMYTDHFQSSATDFKRGDIHELKPDMIPECTLATASFPCTDLSLAGRREGLGGKGSSAFWGFINVLDQLGPKRPPL
ncbi:MAG: DNA cytosine methyltransferase, partial [Lentisphaeria bacterium]